MASSSDVVEFTFPKAGLTVHLTILTVSQLLMAMKAPETAKAKGAGGIGMAVNAEAIRMGLRSVNGEKVTYADLGGEQVVRKLGRMRYFMQLCSVMADFYSPTKAEEEAIVRAAKIRVDDFKEIWKVTLEDGRVIELEEAGLDSLGDALSEAEEASKSIATGQLLGQIAGLRRSIISIDAVPVGPKELAGKGWDRRFTVKETRLLGKVYDELNGAEEEFEVGEARPATGIR